MMTWVQHCLQDSHTETVRNKVKEGTMVMIRIPTLPSILKLFLSSPRLSLTQPTWGVTTNITHTKHITAVLRNITAMEDNLTAIAKLNVIENPGFSLQRNDKFGRFQTLFSFSHSYSHLHPEISRIWQCFSLKSTDLSPGTCVKWTINRIQIWDSRYYDVDGCNSELQSTKLEQKSIILWQLSETVI